MPTAIGVKIRYAFDFVGFVAGAGDGDPAPRYPVAVVEPVVSFEHEGWLGAGAGDEGLFVGEC